jgi:hypothetical protein
MHVGRPAARLEAGKGKADIGRDVAVHPQEFAHDRTPGSFVSLLFITLQRLPKDVPGGAAVRAELALAPAP